jgi:hypothetical protein
MHFLIGHEGRLRAGAEVRNAGSGPQTVFAAYEKKA